MYKKLFIFSILIFVFCVFVSSASAHGDEEHEGMYEVSLSQVPPAPIVGQDANITLTIRDNSGAVAKSLTGEIVVKQLKVKQYVGVNPEVEEVEVYRTTGTVDNDGQVSFHYTFATDSEYDVEFVWGDGHEQSVGEIIKSVGIQSPQKSKNPMNDILLFSVIGIGGVIVGAFATFILLTATFRRKN